MASWDSEVNIQPDYNATERHSPSVREVQFGSGYVKSVVFGLNQDLARWDLRFSNFNNSSSKYSKYLFKS